MNAIFLRGSVPPANEHPEKLLYQGIENCEDMWTQLFYNFLRETCSNGELLYECKTNGEHSYETHERGVMMFADKWVPSFKTHKPHFSGNAEPDVIICRGGFPYYDEFIKRYPNAKKVYYGAGPRIYPTTEFKDYDLFLVDSDNQREILKSKHGITNSALLLKPAATLFKPVDGEKKYDICFSANFCKTKRKRFGWLIKQLAGTGISMMVTGVYEKEHVALAEKLGVDIKWMPFCLRKDLPARYSQCRIGICQSAEADSCPRVIPEFLACGLPIAVTGAVNFWREKYTTTQTGYVVPDDGLIGCIELMLNQQKAGHYDKVRQYYDDNLSMEIAGKHLAELIGGIV